MSQGFDWKTPRDAGAAGASPSAGDDPSPTVRARRSRVPNGALRGSRANEKHLLFVV
jgi:hypothetical protein